MPPPLFAVAGGLLGLAQGAFGGSKNKQKRMEEVYNPMALGQQLQARDANANLNPEAAGRAAMQQNTATQQAAVGSALNSASGQMANSGEMGNGVGQGVAMSQAAQAAAAPYAQTNAQIQQGVMGQKQQQVDQSSQIGSRIADLSNHVSYYNSADQNTGGRLLGGLVGGLNAATNIFGLINGKDATVESGQAPTGVPMKSAVNTNQQAAEYADNEVPQVDAANGSQPYPFMDILGANKTKRPFLNIAGQRPFPWLGNDGVAGR